MTADDEWDVTSDPPTPVTADSAQQAVDERVRLELESAPDGEDDPRPRLYARPSGTGEPWQKLYPNWPPITAEDI